MRVLIVDDHPLIQEILPALLRKAIGRVSVSLANNLDDALAHVEDSGTFDLVLLDLGLPGCNGIEALKLFADKALGSRIVVVSSDDDPETIRAALMAGAAGYVPKTYKSNQIVAALRVVAEGETYVPREILGIGAGHAEPSSLSGREREVLRLLLRGLNNRDIGRQLLIAESTVKQHVGAIYTALGVRTRAEAMVALRRVEL